MKEECLCLQNSKKDDEVAVPVCAQEHERYYPTHLTPTGNWSSMSSACVCWTARHMPRPTQEIIRAMNFVLPLKKPCSPKRTSYNVQSVSSARFLDVAPSDAFCVALRDADTMHHTMLSYIILCCHSIVPCCHTSYVAAMHHTMLSNIIMWCHASYLFGHTSYCDAIQRTMLSYIIRCCHASYHAVIHHTLHPCIIPCCHTSYCTAMQHTRLCGISSQRSWIAETHATM